MSMSDETKAAVKAHRERDGSSHRTALAAVKAERKAAEWNALWPEGTPCILETYRGGPKANTKTRSLAWAPGGDAMVLVEGRAGGYCLDFLTPGKQLAEVTP